MFLSNISIAKRLAIVLGVILALFLASSAVSALKLRQLGVEITGMVEDNVRTEPAPTGCATPPRACSAPPPSPRAAMPA